MGSLSLTILPKWLQAVNICISVPKSCLFLTGRVVYPSISMISSNLPPHHRQQKSLHLQLLMLLLSLGK